MYITNTTENVKELFDEIDKLDDIGKLRFLIYTYGLLNNNQINSKNEENPDLIEDEDMMVFNMQSIGFADNYCTIFLQYLVMINNIINEDNQIYEDNGNVIGVNYNEDEMKLISLFEKFDFKDKLDIFSELFIRCDNETYFDKKFTMFTWNENLSGYDIAKMIQDKKKEIK